jgi:hypothetical protein
MRAVVVVVVLCCAVSAVSAGPASDLMAIGPVARPLPQLQPPSSSASTLDELMTPRSEHDIDMLSHAPRRRADRLWRAIDIGTLVASTMMLACDWSKTHRSAARGWAGGQWESNPVLGAHPSATEVNVYFASTAVVNAAIWYALPKKWRAALPALLTLSEVANEINDQRKLATHPGPDIRVCGL